MPGKRQDLHIGLVYIRPRLGFGIYRGNRTYNTVESTANYTRCDYSRVFLIIDCRRFDAPPPSRQFEQLPAGDKKNRERRRGPDGNDTNRKCVRVLRTFVRAFLSRQPRCRLSSRESTRRNPRRPSTYITHIILFMYTRDYYYV